MAKNQIGLDEIKAKQLADRLNILLANYQVFYTNLRGFHWNISGEKFFELHLKFEELYNDAQLKIDEIAERVLTLGYTPAHTFSSYLKKSMIKETARVSGGIVAVKEIAESLQILLNIEREILNLSSKANDEGSNAMMSDYIRQQEKLMWMYTAFLK